MACAHRRSPTARGSTTCCTGDEQYRVRCRGRRLRTNRGRPREPACPERRAGCGVRTQRGALPAAACRALRRRVHATVSNARHQRRTQRARAGQPGHALCRRCRHTAARLASTAATRTARVARKLPTPPTRPRAVAASSAAHRPTRNPAQRPGGYGNRTVARPGVAGCHRYLHGSSVALRGALCGGLRRRPLDGARGHGRGLPRSRVRRTLAGCRPAAQTRAPGSRRPHTPILQPRSPRNLLPQPGQAPPLGVSTRPRRGRCRRHRTGRAVDAAVALGVHPRRRHRTRGGLHLPLGARDAMAARTRAPTSTPPCGSAV